MLQNVPHILFTISHSMIMGKQQRLERDSCVG